MLSGLLTMLSLTTLADTPTLKTLFVAMPDSVIPYLSKNNRLDFIDFMESNMKAEVTNELGGKSCMTALADDSITIQLNEACKVDLLLLNTTEQVDSCQQVIAMIRTLGLQNEHTESTLDFYSLKWHKLSAKPALMSADEKRLPTLVKTSNILKLIQEKLNK